MANRDSIMGFSGPAVDRVLERSRRADAGSSLTKEERDFETRSEQYFAACDRFEVAKKEKKTAELRLDVAAFALGKKVYRSKRVVLIQAGDYPGQLPLDVDDDPEDSE